MMDAERREDRPRHDGEEHQRRPDTEGQVAHYLAGGRGPRHDDAGRHRLHQQPEHQREHDVRPDSLGLPLVVLHDGHLRLSHAEHGTPVSYLEYPLCEYAGICTRVCGVTLVEPFRRLEGLDWNERNRLAEAEAAAVGPTCNGGGPEQPGLW